MKDGRLLRRDFCQDSAVLSGMQISIVKETKSTFCGWSRREWQSNTVRMWCDKPGWAFSDWSRMAESLSHYKCVWPLLTTSWVRLGGNFAWSLEVIRASRWIMSSSFQSPCDIIAMRLKKGEVWNTAKAEFWSSQVSSSLRRAQSRRAKCQTVVRVASSSGGKGREWLGNSALWRGKTLPCNSSEPLLEPVTAGLVRCRNGLSLDIANLHMWPDRKTLLESEWRGFIFSLSRSGLMLRACSEFSILLSVHVVVLYEARPEKGRAFQDISFTKVALLVPLERSFRVQGPRQPKWRTSSLSPSRPKVRRRRGERIEVVKNGLLRIQPSPWL